MYRHLWPTHFRPRQIIWHTLCQNKRTLDDEGVASLMNIDGSCHCGNITWKAIANPDMVAICYCTDCQTFGSSAFQYTARIRRDDFELTSGQLKEHGKLADSGNARYYSFCGDCGSGIHTSNIDGRGLLSVRLGGCHQKDQLPPKLQIWCCSAPSWVSVESDIKLDKQG